MTHVLIIEDDREVATALADMLSLLGASGTTFAHDSRQGLALAGEHSPDLILLDINLPGLDGLEVCRFIRREPGLETIPVIIISVEDHPDILSRAQEAGANDYLVKPVSMATLAEAYQNAIL